MEKGNSRYWTGAPVSRKGVSKGPSVRRWGRRWTLKRLVVLVSVPMHNQALQEGS